MGKPILLSFVQVAIMLSAAFPFMSIRADESMAPAFSSLPAESMSSMQRDNGFAIVPVAVPHPHSADKASVTLWDELARPSPLPVPLPVPRPGDVRHAMQEGAGNSMHQ
ncbi:hypothetical protein [Burkholderia sp. 22313]|uniref:hypothetical protein n=1 Tax=Burkholderia sp. 22313 TaxID=3453908 RepID=UPI002BE19A69|nr:hypothetical protein [Burkholderia sp.]